MHQVMRYDCGKHEMVQFAKFCPHCEIDRLRAALEEFGKHHESCPLDRYLPSPTRQCNCGFREALAGGEK